MGIRTRRAHKHANTHVVGFGIAGFFGFLALLALAFAISLGAVVSSWLEDLPDYNSADAYLVAEPTRVYDAKGNDIVDYYLQQRRSVTLDQISPYVLKATVDTEDRRFYQHGGIDAWGITRAAVGTLSGGGEGASTITQQLVRNTVLSNEQFERSAKRKVREAYISIQMEKKFSKDQILNMYLNTIYYGNGAYGIEAASVIYFNKHANELTLAEAATLAGLPQAPSSYDPTSDPEAAKERRNTVLERMHRQGDITDEEYENALNEELVLNPGKLTESVGKYPYFTDYVKNLLQEDFDSDTIMQGGLKVYTTLDPDLQKAAEDACNRRLQELGNSRLGAALVSIDPSNGYIKAMVGGQDYNKSQYNLATTTYRQMGSSFKMYTLVAAIDSGMNPNIIINGTSPMQITPHGSYATPAIITTDPFLCARLPLGRQIPYMPRSPMQLVSTRSLTPAMPWVFEPTSPRIFPPHSDLKASLQSNNALPLQRLQPVAYDTIPLPLQRSKTVTAMSSTSTKTIPYKPSGLKLHRRLLKYWATF